MNLTEATIKALKGELNEGVTYAQNSLFKLDEVTDDAVLVEYVKTYGEKQIKTDLEYIEVTRGKNHICKLIFADGHTSSFHWGDSGYTLISEDLKRLKNQVVSFIEDDCHILLDIDTMDAPDGLEIYYNEYFNAWQLDFEYGNKEAKYWCNKNVDSWEKASKVAGEFFDKFRHCDFKKTIAETGIDVWVAQV